MSKSRMFCTAIAGAAVVLSAVAIGADRPMWMLPFLAATFLFGWCLEVEEE